MLNKISKNDLYIAYKKTKYELFHDEKSLCLEELYLYENDLKSKIDNLYELIIDSKFSDIELGSFIEITKSFKSGTKKSDTHFASNSQKHHQNTSSEIDMRKLLLGTIDFHILSALWINKVGQHIDIKFSDDIYGSRLQSINEDNFCSEKYSYNIKSPRIFKPYQNNYQRWRNNSFKIIEENHKKSSVIVMTMDISGFFDSVNLQEFTDSKYYERFGLDKLSDWDEYLKEFHENFIALIKRYNHENNAKGLPIGFTASHILANSVLKQFDDEIAKNFNPLYYGRYVDDILFVFNECGSLNSSSDITDFLISKIPSMEYNEKDNSQILYTQQNQKLTFKQEKQKIFYFDKNADLLMLDAIKKEILSVSSEWMLVPNLLDEDSSLLKKIVGIKSNEGEFDDAFRKIENITIKRLGLALLISHSNRINEYLEPATWEKRREDIYSMIENHLFIPTNFIEHSVFLVRTFKLMINSNDGVKALCFLQKVNEMLKLLNNQKDNLDKFKTYLSKSFYEAILTMIDVKNSIKNEVIDKIILEIKNIEDNINYLDSKEEIVKQNSLMFFKDLTYKSYATEVSQYIADKDSNSYIAKLIAYSKKDSEISFLSNKEILLYSTFETELDNQVWNYHDISKFNKLLANKCEKELNIFENKEFFDLSALLFPARFFSSLDLSLIISPVDSQFNDILTVLRGITTKNKIEIDEDEKSKIKTLHVKHTRTNKNPKIAIANLKLDDSYFYASMKNKPIVSIKRFKEVSHVINEALRKDIDYLVLPELALPRKWALYFAKRLLVKNISFITGVDYLHEELDKVKVVRNSIYHFLISDDIGFNHIKLFRQDKTTPAHSERETIRKLIGKELSANDEYKEKYIFNHGTFFFSSLICNEFTDIENRSKLRGKIDAVMIVEWNTDIKYFNVLVESASFDIHCYTVQVNNRKYGDSRIRAPYEKDYDRDVVKIKGGIYDHIVAGEIEIDKLREFQSNYISVSKEFKPVPTGFEISDIRKKF